MKKYLLITIMLFMLVYNLYSQGVQQRSWTDGDPYFSLISKSQGVIIDNTVRLIPIFETQAADSFKFILYGEDGIWPIQKFPISAAYDIDFISEKNKKFYLITDGFERRVFEINYTNPDNPIEAGFSFAGQTKPLVNPVDASIFYENGDRKILITDNGGNRIIKVDRLGGDEEWAYGDGNSGSGFNQLSGPSDAIALSDTLLFLICDQGNSRVILINPSDSLIVWTYGKVGQLNPVDIEYDSTTKEVLITDQGHHRVFFVNMENDSITWQFGTGVAEKTDSTLNSPTDADILANGNILICDTGNERLLEINRQGEIVWSFEHRRLMNLRDADRLPDNRTVIIADYPPLLEHIPIWLGYSDSIFTSPPQSLGKKANIVSLFWDAIAPAGTQLKLQLRSAENLTDLAATPWYGPTENDSFFINPISTVNKIHHQGHSYYQFRAFLETDNPLNTPVLTDLRLQIQYYNKDQAGTITSQVITDSLGMIIASWQYLDFKTFQHEPRNIKISIIDTASGSVLKDFFAEDIDTVVNHEVLTIWDQLKGVQAIQLKATLTTNNTSATPMLDNWKIGWNSTMSTASQLDFINADEQPVSYYRASTTYPPVEKKVDQVAVRLIDLNLAAVQEAITLRIRALRSGDELDVLLERKPEGMFLLKHSVPAVIFNLSIPGNTFLEVFDRDTLIISYVDPTNPADQSSDSALIVQNSIGTLQIVSNLGAAVDTVAIGDTLSIDMTGEFDHNITPAQDTIWIEVFNNETDDKELLPLVELPDTNNQFYTGNFVSAYGLILVQSSTGITNDSLLQTMPGNQIAARYIDNVTLQDLIYVQQVPAPPPDTVVARPHGPIDFDVAPNPFYANRHTNLRIRASSAIGNLTLNRIEIYNLAGYKVRTILADHLQFDLQQPIPRDIFAYCENWWDLKNDNGNKVSSGTYWIKIYGSFTDESGITSKQLTAIRKIVIVR